MSLDEVFGFFGSSVTWKRLKVWSVLEHVTRQELDPIFAVETLFKGTVVDFRSDLHSGGGSYADSFAVS